MSKERSVNKRPKVNLTHELFEKHLRELGLQFDREWQFHTQRKWRADFIINVPRAVLVEIEGGIWTQGRHTRGSGYQKDLDKYNHASIAGFRLLRFSTNDVLHGRAKAFIATHLKDWCK